MDHGDPQPKFIPNLSVSAPAPGSLEAPARVALSAPWTSVQGQNSMAQRLEIRQNYFQGRSSQAAIETVKRNQKPHVWETVQFDPCATQMTKDDQFDLRRSKIETCSETHQAIAFAGFAQGGAIVPFLNLDSCDSISAVGL